MDKTIEFFVPGLPVSAGSKRAFKTKSGKVILVPASDKQKPWMDSVRWYALKEFSRQIKLEGVIFLTALFVMPRPKGHFGTGRNKGILKKNSPKYKDKKPDLSKLIRAVEDAITGVIWRDDAQVVQISASKIYGEQTGVQITIEEAPNKELSR